jgi:hypothetical protein
MDERARVQISLLGEMLDRARGLAGPSLEAAVGVALERGVDFLERANPADPEAEGRLDGRTE